MVKVGQGTEEWGRDKVWLEKEGTRDLSWIRREERGENGGAETKQNLLERVKKGEFVRERETGLVLLLNRPGVIKV